MKIGDTVTVQGYVARDRARNIGAMWTTLQNGANSTHNTSPPIFAVL